MPEKTEHPSIKRFRERSASPIISPPVVLDAQELRETVLKAGADDVGFVEIDRAELAAERDDILHFFPHTKSLVSFVLRMTVSRFITRRVRWRISNSITRVSA